MARVVTRPRGLRPPPQKANTGISPRSMASGSPSMLSLSSISRGSTDGRTCPRLTASMGSAAAQCGSAMSKLRLRWAADAIQPYGDTLTLQLEDGEISDDQSPEAAKDRRDQLVQRSESRYDSDDENEARDATILVGSVLFFIIAAVSGGILGFIFSGAVRLGLATFAALVLGLLLGWKIWGQPR